MESIYLGGDWMVMNADVVVPTILRLALVKWFFNFQIICLAFPGFLDLLIKMKACKLLIRSLLVTSQLWFVTFHSYDSSLSSSLYLISYYMHNHNTTFRYDIMNLVLTFSM